MKHDRRERFEVIKVGGREEGRWEAEREENVARTHALTHSSSRPIQQ